MTTKTDTKIAWETVADRLDALGLKMKIHCEQVGGQAKEVNQAFERLGSAIEATFWTIGTVVSDSAVRKDAHELADTLRNAIADSLSSAGEDVEAATKGLRCRHHQGHAHTHGASKGSSENS